MKLKYRITMHRKTTITLKLLFALTGFVAISASAADSAQKARIKDSVDRAIQPVMQKYGIPGMAIAVTMNGEKYFYDYGVMSTETRQPVSSETIFEIGSISKAFAATLASYAQISGRLSFNDSASVHLPELRGSSFGNISLLNLGTHTSGLPLFVPETITNSGELTDYLKRWTPPYSAGTRRTYSNIGIGMLGKIAAKSLSMSYDDAMEKKIFPALGMAHSYINVPADQMKNYAQGYTTKGAPVRMNVGALASESYGVKTSTADLIRYIEANLHGTKLDGDLQRAITNTHTGYFKAGEMTQDLMWEQYPYPVTLKQLLAGNAEMMIRQDVEATKLSPPLSPDATRLINKTGSTNGFAAYVAFVPAQQIGVVILANKSYPIDQRVTAAHRILMDLAP